MKVIIAGSRTATVKQVDAAVRGALRAGWTITEVVSGGARGADTYGERWTDKVKRFPADWDKHGRAAGPIRNQAMAEYADALIAVWDGESKGTRDMISRARARGLKVFIYYYKPVVRK